MIVQSPIDGMPRDPNAKPSLTKLPLPIIRLFAVLLGMTIFFSASTLVRPRTSSASQGAAATIPPAHARAARPSIAGESPFESAALTPPAKDRHGGLLLGTLNSADYHVWIYSSPQGPVYTVVSPAGDVLGSDLSGDDLYRGFPMLKLDAMQARPAGEQSREHPALMLADEPKD